MEIISKQGKRIDLTSKKVVRKLETANLIYDNDNGRQV